MPPAIDRFGGAQYFLTVLTSLLPLFIRSTSALTPHYCSSQNTGSDSQAVSDNYQSNGACSTTCAGYAFAVVQYKNCWCSNYIPADTTSTDSCSVACPGYPYESCGDESSGLFGYVALGKAPLGTQGAASSSPPSSPTVVSSAAQPTQETQATSPTPQLTTSATPTSSSVTAIPLIIPTSTTNVKPPPPSSTPPSSTPPSSTPPSTPIAISTTPTQTPVSQFKSSSSSSWSATPYTSVMTVTGQVETLTVTPTRPPTLETTVATVAKSSSGGFWSNKGAVGGVFFVVAVVIIAIIAGITFWALRRKRPADTATIPSTTGNNTPQRRPSRLSQMGLIGGVARQPTVPSIQTSGWGPGTSADKSPADTLNADRRSSYPRVVDQRLEPTALWNPLHDNGSHVSIRSFRDDQDYSRRMLRIANPDG